MNRSTHPVQAVPVSPPQKNRGLWWGAAAVAQVGVLFLTLLMGLGWGGILWLVALAQAGAGIWFARWLNSRGYGPVVLVVPVVSFALTWSLAAVSQTVAVACADRVLAAFEQLPPPPGMSVEKFVSPSEGCMAETPAGIRRAAVYDHYRGEFRRHAWRIVTDDGGGMRAERNGVYVYMYNSEGRVYFILGEL